MPAYLESSNAANMALYQRFGFEALGDLAFADLPRHVRFHTVPSTAHRCGIKQIAAGRAIRYMARLCQSGSVRDSKLEQEPEQAGLPPTLSEAWSTEPSSAFSDDALDHADGDPIDLGDLGDRQPVWMRYSFQCICI
jgi:hypothetical protein